MANLPVQKADKLPVQGTTWRCFMKLFLCQATAAQTSSAHPRGADEAAPQWNGTDRDTHEQLPYFPSGGENNGLKQKQVTSSVTRSFGPVKPVSTWLLERHAHGH